MVDKKVKDRVERIANAAPGKAEEAYLEGAKEVNLHGGLDEILKVRVYQPHEVQEIVASIREKRRKGEALSESDEEFLDRFPNYAINLQNVTKMLTKLSASSKKLAGFSAAKRKLYLGLMRHIVSEQIKEVRKQLETSPTYHALLREQEEQGNEESAAILRSLPPLPGE